MIFLNAAFYYLCEMGTVNDTVFFNEYGNCVAMCDAGTTRVHACFDKYGLPLTNCIDERGREHKQCDAIVYRLTEEDYRIEPLKH